MPCDIFRPDAQVVLSELESDLLFGRQFTEIVSEAVTRTLLVLVKPTTTLRFRGYGKLRSNCV